MKKISVIIFLLLTIPLLSLAQEQLIIEEPVCEVCPLCETCPVIPMDPLKICNDPELEKQGVQEPCSFVPPEDKTEVPKEGSIIIELPVRSLQNTLTGWTRVGVSPYLDTIDWNASYITSIITASTGYYSFATSTFNLGDITKVELMVYCNWSALPESNYGTFYVRNGSAFVSAGLDDCGTAFGWVTYDITETANLSEWTFSTINNTQFYATYTKLAGSEVLTLDAVKLRVSYDPITSGADPTKELISSTSTEAEFYLDKTINYGDIIVIVFLSLFLIGIICKVIYDFVFNRD